MTAENSWTTLFDCLRAKPRRRILTALAAKEEICGDQLSEEIATEISQTEWVHIHLPKLAENDFIVWDRNSGTIGRGERFSEVETLLAVIQTESDTLPDDWI
ncbi:hypothetical protein ACFQL1_16300 [Halomicroarcula sp. GCM10025709]|uniref:hypothetical protein n=1 Tax=Haloarcula TaxID=2237 RepID=UPI0024C34BF4|nr:hypothetical protein [Halomicroarcula sp. YJ-61-S]